VSSTFFFAMILTDQLRRVHGVPSRQGVAAPSERQPILPSLLVLPNDYGLLCVTFAVLAWPLVFVPVYSLLMLANALFLAVALYRWAREVRTF
jgi:hypothetical protein